MPSSSVKNRPGAAAPSADAVRLHLEKVLASPEFSASQMACSFLRYVVDETLAGRTNGLKEYVIGRQACGRAEDFDPRLDPVVRVQASKLRARLAAYYQGGGAAEALRIDLPKGSYVPEFRLSTHSYTEDQPPTEGTSWQRPPSRRVWILASVATPVLVVLSVMLANIMVPARKQPPGLQIRIPISLPQPLEYFELATPALSPDQKRVAVTGINAGAKSLYLVDLDAMDRPPRPMSRAATSPFFSPDGAFLAYFVGGDLMRVNQTGEATLLWKSKAGWTSPSGWSVSGEILFWDGPNSPIYTVPAKGGTPREVTRVDAASRESGHRWPAALPDGLHFLYTAAFAGSPRTSVFAGSLRDPAFRRLVLEDSEGAQFVAPDRLVFIRGQRLYQQRFDARGFHMLGEPLLAAEDVHLLTSGIPAFTVGTSVLVWRRMAEPVMTRLTWYNRRGEAEGSIGGPMKINNPVLSRDGHRLLAQVAEVSDRSIRLYDLLRNESRLVTAAPGDHFNAAWAADGRSFFFSSNRKGIKNIYRQWLDEFSREEEVLVTGRDKNLESSSPDGRYLVFNEYDHRSPSTLWVLPLEQRDRKPLLVGPGIRGSIAPNGRWIVYVSERGVITVSRVPGITVDDRTWRLGDGDDPQWSSDGKELFFLRGGYFLSTPVRQMGETLEFGLPRRLFTARTGPSPRNHYTFSANNNRFIFDTPMPRSRADVLMLLTNWAK